MKTHIFGGIVLIILGGLFTKFKIFDDKIELKYSLSEKIPSDFVDNIDESVIQQLTIKNSGDVPISSIVVKISALIQDVKISKFKSTDSSSISRSKNHLEILYPELPPLGEIIVLLKTTGSGIYLSDIEIFHSKGMANEAFSKNDSNSQLFYYSLSLLYIFGILILIRSIFTDALEINAKSKTVKILQKNKPWFVTGTRWDEIRKVALNNYFSNENNVSIKNSETYQILNSEKLNFLSEAEWRFLQNKAEYNFRQIITESIYAQYYNANFEELSKLTKPNNIGFMNWQRISNEVSHAYCIFKLRKVLLFNDYIESIEILKEVKPEIVTIDDWSNLRELISTYYISHVIQRGLMLFNHSKLIEDENLNFIEDHKKEKIVELFSKIREGFDQKEHFEQLLLVLNGMFNWNEIPSKPETIKSEEWNKIIDIFNRIIKTEKEATQNKYEATKMIEEFKPLKEKVTNQLLIIDNLLKSPKSIDNVETYNIPFEKGNWEIIKRISEFLRKEVKSDLNYPEY